MLRVRYASRVPSSRETRAKLPYLACLAYISYISYAGIANPIIDYAET